VIIEIDYDAEKQARDFAIEWHGDQKYGNKPFVYHLDMVYQNTKDFCLPPDVRVAAFLHDIIEDTKVTYEMVRHYFGAITASLVESVTDKPGKNRREKHENTYPLLRIYGKNGVALKLCDRLANATVSYREKRKRIFNEYQQEYPFFRHTLYSKEDGLDDLWNAVEKSLSYYL
jgi:(p)ppGpp synthase/HD superfamily hydrolase